MNEWKDGSMDEWVNEWMRRKGRMLSPAYEIVLGIRMRWTRTKKDKLSHSSCVGVINFIGSCLLRVHTSFGESIPPSFLNSQMKGRPPRSSHSGDHCPAYHHVALLPRALLLGRCCHETCLGLWDIGLGGRGKELLTGRPACSVTLAGTPNLGLRSGHPLSSLERC